MPANTIYSCGETWEGRGNLPHHPAPPPPDGGKGTRNAGWEGAGRSGDILEPNPIYSCGDAWEGR